MKVAGLVWKSFPTIRHRFRRFDESGADEPKDLASPCRLSNCPEKAWEAIDMGPHRTYQEPTFSKALRDRKIFSRHLYKVETKILPNESGRAFGFPYELKTNN